jgi:hypothetical protein
MPFVRPAKPADRMDSEAGTLPTQPEMASKDARDPRSRGKVSVIDGPFTETKELIAATRWPREADGGQDRPCEAPSGGRRGRRERGAGRGASRSRADGTQERPS